MAELQQATVRAGEENGRIHGLVREVSAALAKPAGRMLVYSALLGGLASATCFTRLGDPALVVNGDEVAYALILDNMMATGNWISPTITPPKPHLSKPPLYYWLSALTYQLFDDGLWRYRIWSGGFGVVCVLLTGLLGARLFRPEVGLIAGLMLSTNSTFLFQHGARTGAFDAALTCCVLASVLLYRFSWDSLTSWKVWCGIGAVAAAACLFKHPIFGLMLVGLLGAHQVVFRGDLSWRNRCTGPLVALALMTVVAAPWHIAQWERWGNDFLDSYFARNIVTRVTTGLSDKHLQGPWFYVENISSSSHAMVLAWPALVLAGLGCWLGPARRESQLLVGFTLAYLLIFSLSSSKFPHYAFPIYPLLSLLVGVSALVLLPSWLAAFGPRRTATAVMLIFAGGVIWLTALDLRHVRGILRHHPVNVPYALHEYLREPLGSQACQLILYQFDRAEECGLRDYVMCDRFLGKHLPLAKRIEKAEELRQALADGRPAVVLLMPCQQPAELGRQLGLAADQSCPMLVGPPRPYRLLSFHDAYARMRLGESPGWQVVRDSD